MAGPVYSGCFWARTNPASGRLPRPALRISLLLPGTSAHSPSEGSGSLLLELLNAVWLNLVHQLAEDDPGLEHLGEVALGQGFPHHRLDPIQDLLLLFGFPRGHLCLSLVEVNQAKKA